MWEIIIGTKTNEITWKTKEHENKKVVFGDQQTRQTFNKVNKEKRKIK